MAARVPQTDILNNKISNVMSSNRYDIVVLKDEELIDHKSNKRIRDTTQGELKEYTRKKQIIQGRIDMNKQNSSNILFVSESWPSVLMGYNMPTEASHVWVVTKPCALEIQKLLPASIHWVGEEEGRRVLMGHNCHWVVIQGSLNFAQAALNTWCTLDIKGNTKLIICSPAKRHRVTTGFLNKIRCWKNVSHDSLGGVMSSKWRFDNQWLDVTTIGVNSHTVELLAGRKHQNVQQQLRHLHWRYVLVKVFVHPLRGGTGTSFQFS